MRLQFVLAIVLLTGCFDSSPSLDTAYPHFDAADGLFHFEQKIGERSLFHFHFAPGSVGKAWNKAGSSTVEFDVPAGWIEVAGNGTRFALPGRVALEPGEQIFLLAPPGATQVNLTVQLDGASQALHFATTDVAPVHPKLQLVSGENVWNLSAHQEANFPRRIPGEPNYGKSITYFAQYFEDLGYEVEVDPYGFAGLDTPCPAGLTGGTLCPATFSNVVAWKPGTVDPNKIIFVAGGHFDMVVSTTHAAIDNTAGTMATMELARAMAPFEFGYTIMFGLWGGEESGLLGSSFWLQSHPEMRARILSHWNLDGTAASWPAPLPRPDPILLAAGPDVPALPPDAGSTQDPISDSLLAWARTLQTDWLQYPTQISSPRDGDSYPLIIYEGVAAGQVSGYNGYNAQSDQTSFIAAGIPAYFLINADYDGGESWPVESHTERDTLNNLTKYAFYAEEFDIDQAEWESEAIYAEARQALADSWEPYLWFPLYHAILVDLGVYSPPAIPALA